jgi:hypothetical protein
LRKKPGVRERLRRAEAAVDAAVFVLAARWPKRQKRSIEEVLGLLHAGVSAGEIEAAGGARLLRGLAEAGWTLDDEEVDVEAWLREQVERIESGEEWVS